MPNGVEYFMGQTGTGFTKNPGPDSNGTVTWPKDPNANATFAIEISTDLVHWAATTDGVIDFGNLVTYQLPTDGAKSFVRLRVTVP